MGPGGCLGVYFERSVIPSGRKELLLLPVFNV